MAAQLVLLLLLLPTPASAAKPVALVYKGPGICAQTADTTGCAEAAKAAAEVAGFQVVLVGPEMPPRTFFSASRVWIQPGGKAKIEQKTMSPELKAAIKDFVKNGGGYVGFCAGGFLASETLAWEEDDGSWYSAPGFGLLKGRSLYYDQFPGVTEEDPARIAVTPWNGQKRHLYWELGPYFTADAVTGSEGAVVARYHVPPDFARADAGRIMTLRSQYGKGRVYVTAVHPEAPPDWAAGYGLQDPDGSDLSLAVEMIRWAAGLP